jgi:hypothetical protein
MLMTNEIPWEEWLEFMPIDTDNAVEIGARTHVDTVLAMRMGRAAGTKAPPCFLGEVLIQRSFECRPVGTEQWLRLEFRVSTEQRLIRSGHFVVQALFPYASGWTQTARFKPAWKHGQYGRPEPPTQSVARPDSHNLELLRWVESLTHDPWETGKYLVAGILIPDVPHRFVDRTYQPKSKAADIFGLCEENPSDLVEEILMSDDLRKLLDRTEKDRIRFWYPRAPRGCVPALYGETKDASGLLMLLSIRQALAGPRTGSEDWVGKPVVALVDRIYRAHLNNYNRLEHRKRERVKSGLTQIRDTEHDDE